MRWIALLLVAGSTPLFAADAAYRSAQAKFDRFQNHTLKPGEVVVFTPAELNAWARVRIPEIVPQGIRDERVDLGTGTASAYALVDIVKMREARGKSTNWVMASMLEGERPLNISVRIASGGGRCTVYLTRVEVSGVSAEGSVLDFLIKDLFLPLYPDAKINEPFELDYNIDRIDVRPNGVRVTIKR